MPKKAVTVELKDVDLSRRFRKYSGKRPDRKDKTRQRAKVDVVQTGPEEFGVTIRRGTVTVKKAVATGSTLNVKSLRAAVQRDIRAGKYDSALFDAYERLKEKKKTAKKR
ncbi:MAG: hypothetical protein OEW11_02800 [Nitrospirota bacterium]|nr:hypothetical protein [Nitrospirota bacterium]